MIQIFFSAIFCANILAPQTKPHIEVTHPGATVTKNNNVFTSEWEPATAWNRVEDKGSNTIFYTHQRALSQPDAGLSEKGIVVVFTKGYTLGAAPEKPMSLPFTYFSNDASSVAGFSWYQHINNKSVEVQLSVPASLETHFASQKQGIYFRYFVLSSQFLEQKGITPAQLKSLSYKKFVALVGTTE